MKSLYEVTAFQDDDRSNEKTLHVIADGLVELMGKVSGALEAQFPGVIFRIRKVVMLQENAETVR